MEGTSNLQRITDSLLYWAKNESLYKRFMRFFDKRMDLRGIGLFLLKRFLFLLKNVSGSKKVMIYLIIDRHEWERGKKVNNLLTLMIYSPEWNIGFPIQVIDLDSKGNSSIEEREFLLEEVYEILREDIERGRIEVMILGDREFVGERWEDYIGSKFGNYILRVKRDYEVCDGKKVVDIYKEMGIGEVREIRRDGWRVVIKRLSACSDRRDDCLALVTLDMSSKAEEIIGIYGKRWRIEKMFLNMESNGFRISDTRFRDSSKVEMLVYILAICYYLSEVVGRLNEKEWMKGKKSIFLAGFRGVKRLFRGIFLREIERIWEILVEFESRFRMDLAFNLVAKSVQ